MTNETRAIVHEVGEEPAEFDTLCSALRYVTARKITGYIVVRGLEGNEVINVRKGKRPGVKKGTWVPCA